MFRRIIHFITIIFLLGRLACPCLIVLPIDLPMDFIIIILNLIQPYLLAVDIDPLVGTVALATQVQVAIVKIDSTVVGIIIMAYPKEAMIKIG